MLEKKLPLTVLKADIKNYKNNSKIKKPKSIENLITINKFSSKVKPENFYKPISKIIEFNGAK